MRTNYNIDQNKDIREQLIEFIRAHKQNHAKSIDTNISLIIFKNYIDNMCINTCVENCETKIKIYFLFHEISDFNFLSHHKRQYDRIFHTYKMKELNDIDKIKYLVNLGGRYYSDYIKGDKSLQNFTLCYKEKYIKEDVDLPTVVWWIINGVNDWNDKKVCCQTCGKSMREHKKCIQDITTGYRPFCSRKCVMNNDQIKQHYKELSLQNWGTETFFGSSIGQDIIHQSMLSSYGVVYPAQSKEIHQKMTNTLKEHIEDGTIDINIFSKIATDGLEKRIQTSLSSYGTEFPSQSEQVKEKIRKTCQNNWKSNCYLTSEDFKTKYLTEDTIKNNLKKQIQTKRNNKSFNVSNEENKLLNLLIEKFGKNNIKTQFSDNRYPFLCDFYIEKLDLFIEYNGHWTHGSHPFDINNKNDILKLNYWRDKSVNSRFYKNAINVWTVRDTNKRQTAILNNLNYKELWSMKEAIEYINFLSAS